MMERAYGLVFPPVENRVPAIKVQDVAMCNCAMPSILVEHMEHTRESCDKCDIARHLNSKVTADCDYSLVGFCCCRWEGAYSPGHVVLKQNMVCHGMFSRAMILRETHGNHAQKHSVHRWYST